MDIEKIIIGKYLSDNRLAMDTDEAEKIVEYAKSVATKKCIEYDFSGIEVTITAFLNVIIGRFIKEYTDTFDEHIKITNASEVIMEQIEKVKKNAIKQFVNED